MSGEKKEDIYMTQFITENWNSWPKQKDIIKKQIQFRDRVRWIYVEEYGSYLFKSNYIPERVQPTVYIHPSLLLNIGHSKMYNFT